MKATSWILTALWILLFILIGTDIYLTFNRAVRLEFWLFTFIFFLALLIGTPLFREYNMRRKIKPLMLRAREEMQRQADPNLTEIRCDPGNILFRPKLIAYYKHGLYQSMTIKPQYDKQLPPSTYTEFPAVQLSLHPFCAHRCSHWTIYHNGQVPAQPQLSQIWFSHCTQNGRQTQPSRWPTLMGYSRLQKRC